MFHALQGYKHDFIYFSDGADDPGGLFREQHCCEKTE